MTVAIFGTPGFVERAETFDLPHKLKVTGDNTGNLLFQHAVANFVDGEKVFIGLAKRNYGDPVLRSAAKALLFPAANHLRAEADWTGLNSFLEKTRQKLVIFGLGVQGRQGDGAGGIVAALRANPTVQRMVDIFRDKAAFVGVRGALTAEVCAALGLKDVAVTGCPSLMISADPQLGRTVAARLDALRRGEVPPLVVTAAAAAELTGDTLTVERRLAALLRDGDLYVQQSGGAAAVALFAGAVPAPGSWEARVLGKALFPDAPAEAMQDFLSRHGRVFFSVAEWMSATARAGLFLGTRLHGNMIGLQQGLPCAMIAHDARTSELIGQMHMPRLDIAAFLSAPTIEGVVRAVEFDAEAFDAGRQRAAAIYAETLPRIGVPVTSALRTLAAISD